MLSHSPPVWEHIAHDPRCKPMEVKPGIVAYSCWPNCPTTEGYDDIDERGECWRLVSPGCRPVGTKRVKGTNIPGPGARGVGFGEASDKTNGIQRYAKPDGTEAVAAYECEPGCPIFLLDQQSGTIKDRNSKRGVVHSGERNGYDGGWADSSHPGYNGDEGGASRFFKTFDGEYECVEDCPVRLLDEQSGTLKTNPGTARSEHGKGNFFHAGRKPGMKLSEGNEGGSSRFFKQFDGEAVPLCDVCGTRMIAAWSTHTDRLWVFWRCPQGGDDHGIKETEGWPETEPGFFYQAKASRRERNAGLEGMPEQRVKVSTPPGPGRARNEEGITEDGKWVTPPRQNSHPTVKSIALMRYLCRLITPPNGTILDPFCGSGSTGCAAVLEGFNFVGIEKEEEYATLAKKRIEYWSLPESERQSGKAPAKKRTAYGFKDTDVLRRCPEHSEPIPSGSTTYKCGCAKVWHKVEAAGPTEPTEPPETLF